MSILFISVPSLSLSSYAFMLTDFGLILKDFIAVAHPENALSKVRRLVYLGFTWVSTQFVNCRSLSFAGKHSLSGPPLRIVYGLFCAG